jgi:hypothetical protein
LRSSSDRVLTFYGHLKVSKALLPCHGIFQELLGIHGWGKERRATVDNDNAGA